ncbi:allergen Tha p 1-like [Melitaea cinxia]|uniref:allergen Tha p 1-like n=1 Tax=Melitaea cinxia TaxID=113334 RepID=UPI001E270B17|nr:allergen Tha p 1-like [Melitaea cinxia]
MVIYSCATPFYCIHSKRLLNKYLDCFLDRSPCTPVGKVFKSVLPEVVKTACSKCSPMQKRFAGRTFQAFKRYLPEKHEELKHKLDPKNTYFANFESVISMS